MEDRGTSVRIWRIMWILWLIPIPYTFGWLWLQKSSDWCSATFSTGKKTHHRGVKQYGADFRKDNGERWVYGNLTGAWETAMIDREYPSCTKEEAPVVFNYIAGLVDKAYRFHFPFHCDKSAA